MDPLPQNPAPLPQNPALVPEFLSEKWFEALATALSTLPVTPGPAPVITGSAHAPANALALGQIVTSVPDDAGAAGVHNGEVRYTIVLGQEGSASLVRDSTERADVTIVEDWPTAQAIVSGTSSLPDLLAAGKIKLRGDSNALVSAADLLSRVAPLIVAALAAATTDS